MMVTKWSAILPKIFLFFLFLVGCTGVNQTTPILINQNTSTVPTLSFSSPSPTQTPTPIIVSTLPPDEAYLHLTGLLKDKGCQLPCWLGITPGQSTLQDAQKQILLFSGIALWFYVKPTGSWSTAFLSISYPDDSMKIGIYPSFFSPLNLNIISTIAFETDSYRIINGTRDIDIYDFPPYSDLMERYTLSNIFTTYGVPDQIYIQAVDTTPLYYFQIHIWYPQKGVFLQYQIIDYSAVEENSNYHQICPEKSLVSGYLIQPGILDYQSTLLQNNYDRFSIFFPPSDFVKNTIEAFGMTNEEFYQLYHSPTSRCVYTPKSVWPSTIAP
jgi:hypothetical protein